MWGIGALQIVLQIFIKTVSGVLLYVLLDSDHVPQISFWWPLKQTSTLELSSNQEPPESKAV